ncbi:hypothetical protein Agub_g1941 [Astrephomene gubernaculifera]|uniref:Uncharacterized protein n=1 Tax=Astrephomene gubernaculifera TaxID=47775 RepID=A0AAD3DJV0_9CHLO|nr:hypothetical protein Agub_g1941 [Astrephomene gubernaculifera]
MEASQSPSRTLADVLRQIDTHAADALHCHLRKLRCLRQARLAFRQFRDITDGSVQEAHVLVTEDAARQHNAGTLPNFSRWPRLKTVNVIIQPTNVDGSDFNDLLLLPFTREQPATRERITTLTMQLKNYCEVSRVEASIASVAHWLPSLEVLKVQDVMLLFDGIEQESMFRELATLRNLRSLELSDCRGLEHVELLAGSLQELNVDMRGGDRTGQLSSEAVESLARLQQLTFLKFAKCVTPSLDELAEEEGSVVGGRGMQLLLSNLPPSLKTLELDWSTVDSPPLQLATELKLELRNRTCTRLWLGSEYSFPVYSLQLARVAALLLSGCLQVQLQELSLHQLLLLPEEGEQFPELSESGPLRKLLRCGARSGASSGTEVRMCVNVLQASAPSHVLAWMALLGKPWTLKLTGVRQDLIKLKLRGVDGAPGLEAAQPDTPAAAAPSALPEAPSAADMAACVLGRLKGTRFNSRFLLLQGPAVSVMLWQPQTLVPFLEGVQRHAVAGDGSNPASHRELLRSYKTLPPFSGTRAAVLLECIREKAAVAVAAGIAIGAVSYEPDALQVLPVQATGGREGGHSAHAVVVSAMQQELQAMWDNEAARRRAGEQEWLRQLLGVWSELKPWLTTCGWL